jgi:predicted transcriptional regulator
MEIAAEVDMPANNVKQLLRKMVKAGEVDKLKRGQYAIPGSPDNFDTFDNFDEVDEEE